MRKNRLNYLIASLFVDDVNHIHRARFSSFLVDVEVLLLNVQLFPAILALLGAHNIGLAILMHGPKVWRNSCTSSTPNAIRPIVLDLELSLRNLFLLCHT